MCPEKVSYPFSLKLIAIVAIIFGVLTIRSGGMVLFSDGLARENAGHYVPFVLWFNFSAGFFYLLSAVLMFINPIRGFWLAVIITLSTLLIFALFGLHIMQGGLYETRTVYAMILRVVIWALITLYLYKRLKGQLHS
ncbi:MAG TPA: hypothetical protein ENJ60_01985 [Aeromonadales bacterium]|nr:hypothetical protein [Aeromonadales bacterium]